MGYHLGIDAGTTYTAAAVHRDGQVEIVPLGDRAASIPSVIFLKDDGSVLTGDAAYRRGLAEPERVAFQFKRRVGDATSILLGGTPYSADALMAKLFRWTVDKVSELEGGPPDTVALTHPANWGDYKLDRLDQAIRMADLTGAVTLTEPEAAAIHYASNERIETGSTIAVYDLGGGTFDVAILRKNPGGWEILGSPEGIEQLGGVDVDEAVYDHVRRTVPDAFASLDATDPATRAAISRLRRECVEAKEALSSDTDVNIAVLLPSTQTQVRLTRSELESMIGPTLEDTVGAMERAMRSADVVPADMTAVLLVGGSSRIPMVAELVSSAFGRPIAVDTHPKHSIALGAALAAAGDNLPTGPTETPISVVHTDEAADNPILAPPPAPVDETSSLPSPPVDLPPPPVDRPPPLPADPPPPPPEPEPDPQLADPVTTSPIPDYVTPPPTPEPVLPPDPTPPITRPKPEPVPLKTEGGDGDGPNKLLLIGGAVGLVLLVVLGAIFALGGGGDDDPEAADDVDTTEPAENGGPEVPGVELIAGRTYPTTVFPDGITIGPNGNVWVAMTGSDEVLRIDVRTGVTQSVPFRFDPTALPPEGVDPLAITLAQDGSLWVSFRNLAFLARIDSQTLQATQVPINATHAGALVESGSSLLVSHATGVDVISTARQENTATVEVDTPSGIAVRGSSAWVVSRGTQSVVEIDLTSNTLTGTSFPVGSEPDGVAIDDDGTLWVTNRGEGTVSVIDPESGETETIEVGTAPADILHDNGTIWLTDNEEGTLINIDVASRSVAATLPVGPGPLDLAIQDTAVLVSVSGNNTVQWVWSAPPSFPFAAIGDVEEVDGRYVFDYTPSNYTADTSGELHTHFFWNTTPALEAGLPDGSGDWLIWDEPQQVSDPFFDVASRPAGAVAICAVVANAEHQVADVTGNGQQNYNSGGCAKLP